MLAVQLNTDPTQSSVELKAQLNNKADAEVCNTRHSVRSLESTGHLSVSAGWMEYVGELDVVFLSNCKIETAFPKNNNSSSFFAVICEFIF